MKKIVSINYFGFQSPRSGKFVSDIKGFTPLAILSQTTGFNPLDRGNLYQIAEVANQYLRKGSKRFNPLDRGNLYQISEYLKDMENGAFFVSIP